MRTLNQLQSNLKDGYKLRKFGGKVTGVDAWIVDTKGNKITCQVTTVKAFIDECVEMGLTK
jgi:hypothetical protein